MMLPEPVLVVVLIVTTAGFAERYTSIVIFSSVSKSMGAAEAALLKLGMLTKIADIRLKAIALVFICFSAVWIIPVLAVLTRVAIGQFRLMFTPFVAYLQNSALKPELKKGRSATLF
jgi:hypothetical protein